MTVEELQGRMSYAEFVEWQAFAATEPIGGARADYHTAMLMTLLASIWRGKRAKPPRLARFLPDWWSERRRPANLLARFRVLTGSRERGADAERPRNVGRRDFR